MQGTGLRAVRAAPAKRGISLRCRRCGGRLMMELPPGNEGPELACLQCGYRPRLVLRARTVEQRLAS